MKSTFIALMAWLSVTSAVLAQPDEAEIKEAVQRLHDSDANAWRRIPWTTSLLEARTASQREGRPLLLFSYEGNIETGRC